ncbi:MAG: DegT/DnrJ/EryC1/StrS family aminotransferase [Isosphaeraceae bacterium]
MTDFAVPLSRPSIGQDDIAAVLEVLRSPNLSMGPAVRRFERAVAEYVGAAEAVAVNNGTSGLHLCLAAEGIGPGDEVITTPFSFIASANCALYQGARPVFADIDPLTLNLDPRRVEAAVTRRTRAIISVDVFGQPGPTEALRAIADRHGIVLVEDACEAIGAERNGRRVGTGVRSSVFAFYPNKAITTGEGGMIVTDDRELAAVMRSLANQGRDDAGTWMNHVRLGFNYRLDEMSAALGVSQMARLDRILDQRARVAGWYARRLREVEGIRLPYIAPETTRMSWFLYVIQLDAWVDRANLMNALEEDGIPSRPYFVPIHLQPLYRERFGHGPGEFPTAERVARSTLALPFFTEMTEDQVNLVCDRLMDRLRASWTRSRLRSVSNVAFASVGEVS